MTCTVLELIREIRFGPPDLVLFVEHTAFLVVPSATTKMCISVFPFIPKTGLIYLVLVSNCSNLVPLSMSQYQQQ